MPRWEDGTLGASVIGGLALGAGFMYLLDPVSGRRRRARAVEKARHAQHELNEAAYATAKDLAHRSRGVVAKVQSRLEHDHASDEVLVARVRSALGFCCSHPGAIEVAAEAGHVQLHGSILARELRRVVSQVRRVKGVKTVRQDLKAYTSTEGVSELQGGKERAGRRFELLQRNWSPAVRLLTGVGGLGMLGAGAARRDPLGAPLALVGTGFLLRALVNEPLREALGLDPEHHTVSLMKTIHIDAPVDEVFDLWTHPETFPRFMRHVRKVTNVGPERWHWVVRGPLGFAVDWDAQVIEFDPDKKLAWRTLAGSTVRSSGTVHFDPTADGATRVHVQMEYTPPFGIIGHAVAKALGSDPKHEMDDDLLRLKSLLETGKATGQERTVTWEEVAPRQAE